jgi:hypothetical protein
LTGSRHSRPDTKHIGRRRKMPLSATTLGVSATAESEDHG